MPERKKQKKLRDKAQKGKGVLGQIAKKQRKKAKTLQAIFDDNSTGR